MFNYKSTLALGTMLLLPFSVFADTCATLPDCADLGFVNTAEECGTLKKLKCPFGDAYFCSTNNCKSVRVSTSELCTEYCADDKNVCIAKRAMTCSEFLNINCDSQYSDGQVISGNITGKVCVKGTVSDSSSSSSPNFVNSTVYDAGLLYEPCDAEMTGRAKLELNSASIDGYATFNIDVEIASMNFYYSDAWSANFGGNTTITVHYVTNLSYLSTLGMNFSKYSSNDDRELTSSVTVYCEGGSDSSWNPAKCEVQIGASGENNVAICPLQGSNSSIYCSSGSCHNEITAYCNGQENPSEGCTIYQNSSMCFQTATR